MMSTEHDYAPGSPQWQWLEADLQRAAANRGTVPWVILVGHRPMYCSDKSEKDEHWPGAVFQQQIEPLMARCVWRWRDCAVAGLVLLLLCLHCYRRHRASAALLASAGSVPLEVNIHSPFFSSCPTRYGVDMYLSGHMHMYEVRAGTKRSAPESLRRFPVKISFSHWPRPPNV